MTTSRDRHDRLFKGTFNDLKNLEVELRAALPPGLVKRIDFSTLQREPVNFQVPGMGPIEGDLLVSAQVFDQRVFFWILVEHQSSVDVLMPLRFYGYCYGAWVEFAQNRRSQGQRVLPLPAILPVLVHHSETGWTAARSFQELFDPALLQHAEMRRYLPSFEFILDDLSQLSAEQILGRARQRAEGAAALVLLALRFGRDPEEFFTQLLAWSEFVESVIGSAPGADAFRAVLEYLEGARDSADVLVELRRAIEESHASLAAKEAVMSIAEQLRLEGRAEGRVEGRVEGRAEGERSLLLKQLTLKFGQLPDAAVAALEAADERRLETWAERILTASSLDEVLGA